jgi:hypothetical protein
VEPESRPRDDADYPDLIREVRVGRRGELLRNIGYPNEPSDPASLVAAVQELLGRFR